MDERARERRQRLQTRRFASNADADAAEREPWPPLTAEERVELAWTLSEETLARADPAFDRRRRGECDRPVGVHPEQVGHRRPQDLADVAQLEGTS